WIEIFSRKYLPLWTTTIIHSHCTQTTTLKRGDIVSISLLCTVVIAQSSSGACSRTHCAYLLLRAKKKKISRTHIYFNGETIKSEYGQLMPSVDDADTKLETAK